MICTRCGSKFNPEDQRRFGEFNCSYHVRDPISIGNTGPRGDYAELWMFPCCGKGVVGQISDDGNDVKPSQSPGCRNDFHEAGRARLFLSYSRSDSRFASFLESEMERRGYEIWKDTTDLIPGAAWLTEIDESIRQSTHVVLLLSPVSVSRPQVQREVEVAIRYDKLIIPILIETCKVPDHVRTINIIDWRMDKEFPYSSNFDRLREALDMPLRKQVIEEIKSMGFKHGR